MWYNALLFLRLLPRFLPQGTKHKTIQEARSGLGPIKAYPRLGPRVPGEPGASPNSEANSEERTFHCEICNVRVNSELQLKQVRRAAGLESEIT